MRAAPGGVKSMALQPAMHMSVVAFDGRRMLSNKKRQVQQLRKGSVYIEMVEAKVRNAVSKVSETWSVYGPNFCKQLKLRNQKSLIQLYRNHTYSLFLY